MRIPGDQQRNPVPCVPLKKKDRLLRGCSEEIAGFETKAERGPGDLGDEQVALSQPVHITRKYFLRGYAAICFPGILADQVTREDFVPQGLESDQNLPGCLDRGTIPGNRKAQVDFHITTQYPSTPAAGTASPSCEESGDR